MPSTRGGSIYLPPTMSPSETAKEGIYLEHPREALAYYRAQGMERVICEEKHMGSRAVLVLCRDQETARTRFRCSGEELGVCYTRTGRAFFSDTALERELIARTGAAMTKAGLWDELGTNWVCLDAELMPWSAKARSFSVASTPLPPQRDSVHFRRRRGSCRRH